MMKRILIISILLNCLAWCGGGTFIYGQDKTLPTSGNWSSGDQKYDLGTGNTITVNLTDNVTMKSSVRIHNNTTLKIQLASSVNKPITITNKITQSPKQNYLFYIESGSKLIITGQKGKEIIIDGGADFTWISEPTDGVYLKKGSGTTYDVPQHAIRNEGTLALEYVTIEDVNISENNKSGGAILICGVKNDENVSSADWVHVKNGTTTLKNCTIQRCAAGHGSAIHIRRQNGNTSNTVTSCAVTIENTIIQNCYTGSKNGSKTEGGTIRTNGNAMSNLTLKNVQVLNNYSEYFGGGLYWNAGGRPEENPTCTIIGCTFEGNKAGSIGGGMMLETSFVFDGETTTVKNNVAGDGGGIIITGYNGGGIRKGEFTHNFTSSLKVLNNYATGHGGGIAYSFKEMSFDDDTKYDIKFNGATIEGNTAGIAGGGVHFLNDQDNEGYKQNLKGIKISTAIYLNAGTIKNNEALNGAGMYIYKTDIGNNAESGDILTLENNEATNNGGGIYLKNGSASLGTIDVKTNKSENGAGLCIENGAFTMGKGSVFKNNTATSHGGGLYVFNTGSTSKKVSCSGGTFSQNNAYIGGGVSLSGLLAMTMDGTDIKGNTATNGGGIYLRDGASLTYSSGLIKDNKAIVTDGTDTGSTGTQVTYNTAFEATASSIAGVGGGVFLDSGKDANTITSLSFKFTDETTPLGFYDNRAYTAADDIFANGVYTSVELPNVEKMNLTGFIVPTSALYWFEDYVTKDAAYESGSKVQEVSNGSNEIRRYRYSIKEVKDTYAVTDFVDVKNKYLCLHLGFQYIMATIKKSGLLPGENAVFKVYNIKDDNTEEFHANVFLKGPEIVGEVVSKNIALVEGKWKIYETDWSWTYTSKADDQSNNKYVQKTIKANQRNIFPFTNDKNKSISKTKYGEDVEENEMKKL